jgi:hypothetical protein
MRSDFWLRTPSCGRPCRPHARRRGLRKHPSFDRQHPGPARQRGLGELLSSYAARSDTYADDKIQPTPDVASEMAKKFVRGVIATDGRMISLIALDSVLPSKELQAA